MDFIKYNNIQEFNRDNLNLLLEKEWLNNLIIGNCLEGPSENEEPWILASIKENNITQLIMLYRKPWNLLLYSPTNNISDVLYKFAAKEIYKIDDNLNGVNAEVELADKFAKYYSAIANKEAKLNFPMRILLLKELDKAELIDNVLFRKANQKDEAILLKYLEEFQQEALGEYIDEKTLKERLNSYFKKGYFVLEKDEKIVSQAVISRELTKGKTISEVYTPKEFRGKSYAYNLIYRISKQILEEGAEFCVLYTDDNNPISNHVYEKIGYKRMVDTKDIKFI